jgi:hypothetical protein
VDNTDRSDKPLSNGAWFALGVAVLLGLVVGFAFYRHPEDLIQQVMGPAVVAMQMEEAPSDNDALIQEEREEAEEPGLELAEIKRRLGVAVNLGEIFSGEQAFYDLNGRYTTDLLSIEWFPQQTLMGYKLGFLSPSPTEGEFEDPTRMTSDVYLLESDDAIGAPFVYDPQAHLLDLRSHSRLCRRGCSADSRGFELMIVVPIGDEGRMDVWLLNERKELTHVWDGVSGQRLD